MLMKLQTLLAFLTFNPTNMTKEKLLTYLVLVLVILNGGTLIFILTDRHGKPPRRPHVFEVITERLKLNETQQDEFEKLRRDHRKKMDSLDDNFEQVMLNYFGLLKDVQVKKSLQDSLEAVMGNLEKQKAKTTFDHFRQVKNILHEDQKNKFDQLAPELVKVMGSKKSPPPRRD